MNNAIQIKMTVELDRQRVVDTLINALEGGSNYWLSSYSLGSGEDDSEKELQGILNGERTMTVKENDRDAKTYKVTVKDIEEGLQLLASKYPWHLKNLIDESDDAETADVLLQLAALKEVVYG